MIVIENNNLGKHLDTHSIPFYLISITVTNTIILNPTPYGSIAMNLVVTALFQSTSCSRIHSSPLYLTTLLVVKSCFHTIHILTNFLFTFGLAGEDNAVFVFARNFITF